MSGTDKRHLMHDLELAALATMDCPICGGNGVAADDETCTCKFTYETNIQHAQFPSRFERTTLGDLNWQAIAPTELRTGIQEYANHLEDYLDNNLGLLLSGPVGCGKTHIAIGVGKIACALGCQVLFVSIPEWFQALRESYADPRCANEYASMSALKNAVLLILDDLGAERSNDWVRERLYLVVNHRTVRQLPTLVTTNETLDELEQSIGKRTLSRLRGDALVLTLSGEDYRQIEKRERLKKIQYLTQEAK